MTASTCHAHARLPPLGLRTRFRAAAERAGCLALAAALLSACAAGPPARSPNSTRTAAGRGELKASAEADYDHDGIADQADAMPEPAPAYRGNDLAAPAGGAAPPKAPPPPPPPPGAPATTPGAGPGEKKTDTAREEAAHDTAFLVYTAQVTMAVYQVEQGVAAVEKVARDMGGYLAVKRDREITVRVPRARFEPTLSAIDKIGDVLHRDVQAQDVTDEYVDVEIRIKNARAMQVRLKQLLDKASVKEALEIEKEMRRVTEELELLEGKLKLLKDRIAYSTITVTFEARGSSIQTTRIRLPFPWLGSLGLPSLLQLDEVK